jgi:hypothetical protein
MIFLASIRQVQDYNSTTRRIVNQDATCHTPYSHVTCGNEGISQRLTLSTESVI